MVNDYSLWSNRVTIMPWTPAEFRKKHNQKLTMAQARKAAKQANAILRSGASEAVAIATANKRFERKSVGDSLYGGKK